MIILFYLWQFSVSLGFSPISNQLPQGIGQVIFRIVSLKVSNIATVMNEDVVHLLWIIGIIIRNIWLFLIFISLSGKMRGRLMNLEEYVKQTIILG